MALIHRCLSFSHTHHQRVLTCTQVVPSSPNVVAIPQMLVGDCVACFLSPTFSSVCPLRSKAEINQPDGGPREEQRDKRL